MVGGDASSTSFQGQSCSCTVSLLLLLRGCCLLSGGSTNAVLHLIAMSRAAGLNVTLDDFQRVSDKVRESEFTHKWGGGTWVVLVGRLKKRTL